MGQTVVLLAGGRSQRMGADKALLPWKGKPLLWHLVERFQGAGFFVLIAGGPWKWAKRLEGGPAPVVPDLPAHEGFGPLAGMEAGLLATREERVGVVACDLPYAEPKLLTWLAERGEEVHAVVPLLGSQPQPLHAVYARSCLPLLKAQLEGPDHSVQAFLRRLEVLWVEEAEWRTVAEPACLTVHLNEPKDWNALRGDTAEPPRS